MTLLQFVLVWFTVYDGIGCEQTHCCSFGFVLWIRSVEILILTKKVLSGVNTDEHVLGIKVCLANLMF